MKIEHPYGDLTGGEWLAGNLHSHTTRSDGTREAQQVIDDYAARGHAFLMISDHDIYTDGAAYSRLNRRGMVMIPGNEISANGPHMLHVNGRGRVEPYADRQRAISDAVADGGFVIMNHPSWQEHFNHAPIELLKGLTDYAGLEIYNGVIGRLEGSPYALDKWDMLLSAGRRVWGFANDDSHAATDDCGLGWNVAYVRERTVDGVVSALAGGRFYASTGVQITEISVTGNRIGIVAPDADRVVASIQHGIRVATVNGPEIELVVPERAEYVRFECWGRGESFAWTQPFFVHA